MPPGASSRTMCWPTRSRSSSAGSRTPGRAGVFEPNAMTLATVGADGQPVGAGRPAQGRWTRAGSRSSPISTAARPRDRRQRQGRAGLLVGPPGAPGALRGHARARRRRRGRRLFREPPARQPDRRLGLGAEPGDREPERARGGGATSCERALRRRRRAAAASSGAASAWCRCAPSSGRARPTGCTTGCATAATPTAAGGSSAWRPEPMPRARARQRGGASAPRPRSARRPPPPPPPDPHRRCSR